MRGDRKEKHMYGIYFGKDAAAAVIDEFSIVFCRDGDKIMSILNHRDHGMVGLVVGESGAAAHSSYCLYDAEDDKKYCNADHAAEEYEKQKGLTMLTDENGILICALQNGHEFRLQLAESIDMSIFDRHDMDASAMSTAEKMAKWSVKRYFEPYSNGIQAGIDTERYSTLFSVNMDNGTIYCRVGQNGYCDKGWAMLSTVCLRGNECRMIADNTDATKPYIPNENCFVTDGCAFPMDGGWYWSVREVSEDTIYLNGCGGATYEIHKP